MGKSFLAKRILNSSPEARSLSGYPSFYTVRNLASSNFLNGYLGQRAVLIDDLRVSSLPMVRLLGLIEVVQFYADMKYGYVAWVPRVLVITSILPP